MSVEEFDPVGRVSISSSKLPGLLGLGYKSRYQTQAALRGIEADETTEGDFEVRAKNHGLFFEPKAAALFFETHKEFTPIGNVSNQFTIGLRFNNSFTLSSTPDLFMRSPSGLVLLEIKCPYRACIDGNKNPEFRLSYLAQIQSQLLVTGLRTAYLAIFVPPDSLQTYKIERHPRYQKLLLQMCQASYQENDPTQWRLRPGEKKTYTYLTRNVLLTHVEKLSQ